MVMRTDDIQKKTDRKARASGSNMGGPTSSGLSRAPTASTSRQLIEDYPEGLFTTSASDNSPKSTQYASIHLQPATRQTVVTTTTTTTISFAPLHFPIPSEAPIMSEAECDQTYPSQCLPASSAALPERVNGKLDPRKYPLARAQKPDSLAHIKFPLSGTQATLHQASCLTPAIAPAHSDIVEGPRSDKNPVSLGRSSQRTRLGSKPTSTSSHQKQQAREGSSGESDIDQDSLGQSKKPPRKRVKVRHAFSPEPENPQMPSPIPSPKLQPIHHKLVPSNLSTNKHARKQDQPYPASPPITTVDENFAKSHLGYDSADDNALASNQLNINMGSATEIATLMSLPSLVNQFGDLPNSLQSHVLFNLLKRTPIPVLQVVNEIIAPALKRDFLKDLPLELAGLICTHLDGQSLCRASVVSKKWRRIIDGDGRIWESRLIEERLWVGDGSEQKEARGIELGEAPQNARQRFLKKWLNGTWDMHYNPTHAGKPAARKIQAVHSSPGQPLDNPFAIGQASPLVKHNSAPHRKPPMAPSPLRSQPQLIATPRRRVLGKTASHYVHPYKILYKRRHVSKKRWYTGEPTRHSITGHGTAVTTCLQFDRDRIASASDNVAINIYDLRQNGAHTQLLGHTGGVWALEYLGDTLVSGSTDRTVRVWDLKTGRCTHILLGHISTVRCLQIIEPQNVNPDPAGEPVWEPPYPLIVTGSRDTTLRVWKLPKPGHSDYLPEVPQSPDQDNINPDANPFHVKMMAGHHHAIRALSAHGRIAVSGSYDKTARVWDILTGTCQHVLRGHSQRVYSVEYDPVRQRAATGSMDGSVRLWSTKTGECLHSMVGHDALVGLLGLTPRTLVSGAADSTLRVWDSNTGECLSTLAAHSGAITCFQNDDLKVVSGGDGSLKLWDLQTGRFVRDLSVNCQGVWQVGFQDGFCVAAVLRNSQSEFEIIDFGKSDDNEGDPLPSEDFDKIVEVDDELEPDQELPDQRHPLDVSSSESEIEDSPSFNLGHRAADLLDEQHDLDGEPSLDDDEFNLDEERDNVLVENELRDESRDWRQEIRWQEEDEEAFS